MNAFFLRPEPQKALLSHWCLDSGYCQSTMGPGAVPPPFRRSHRCLSEGQSPRGLDNGDESMCRPAVVDEEGVERISTEP